MRGLSKSTSSQSSGGTRGWKGCRSGPWSGSATCTAGRCEKPYRQLGQPAHKLPPRSPRLVREE